MLLLIAIVSGTKISWNTSSAACIMKKHIQRNKMLLQACMMQEKKKKPGVMMITFMILVALKPCCLLKQMCMSRHKPLQAAKGRNTLTRIQLSQQRVLPSLLADDDKKCQHSYECILDCWVVVHYDRDLSHIRKKPAMQQSFVCQRVISETSNCWL